MLACAAPSASLYLKDLAAKTHRGQEGRVRQGRAIGHAPYGYRVVRQIGANGELERGLRTVEEAEAAVIRRVFTLYAQGLKPLAIARLLNGEGIPGPSGGPWLADTIRGRSKQQGGPARQSNLFRPPGLEPHAQCQGPGDGHDPA